MQQANAFEQQSPAFQPAPLLTAEEVAAMLQVPTTWVYANKERIPGYKRLGRYVRFVRAAVVRWISDAEAVCQ